MNKDDIRKITTAVRRWAKFQPHDDTVLVLAGKSYTASQLAQEMEEQTPMGVLQLNVFQHAVENGEDLNELLGKLEDACR